MDPHQLKEAWLGKALERAGVDRGRWRPGAGLDENRRTVEAVYDYYAGLYLDHPHLKWAGMAGMLGPALYAGFQDLGGLPDAARRAAAAVVGRMSPRLSAWVAGDLGFYETTFLTMQKQIFEDLAPMHEAYLGGGVAEIERLYRAAILDAAALEAWRQIDAGGGEGGDEELVDRGNRGLLLREQRDVIDRFYVRMLGYRDPEGSVFTYVLTLVGTPSVPATKSYAEVFPLGLRVQLPAVSITVRTPLANGNVAVFANRWKLIDDDTLPGYLGFVRDRPGDARALLATPVVQRMPSSRVAARLGHLLAGAITGWGVDVSFARRVRPGLARASTKPLVAARTGATTIDLTRPPTRASAGITQGNDSRVWMNAPGQPFDVTVDLPGGRGYEARAEMAVMLSSVRRGEPDQLSVTLPPLGIDATEQVMVRYVAEWSIHAGAVAGWREAAERRMSSDREYSTYVLTPDDVGFVHLDFQVAHHVREGVFVVAALFSWGRARPA